MKNKTTVSSIDILKILENCGVSYYEEFTSIKAVEEISFIVTFPKK